MRKIHLAILVSFFALNSSMAQTNGSLTVTATTSSAGGNYAPKNIVAIWVEDHQGDFVKTLLAYAQTRKTHLNTWEASTTAAGSPYNTTDAISGATRPNHGTHTCTWNGTDVNGMLVADGTYRLRMELTDKNSTGNFSTFTFTKGPDPENQAPAGVPSFSAISISWEPVITAVNDPYFADSYIVTPNPSNGIFKVSGEDITEIQVISQSGNLVSKGTSTSIDLQDQPDGIYILQISSGKGVATKKVLKK